tara:strand:+ start:1797 stop:3410 length:1614 start_codon:yes stop_codon:yes gene_type:complete
MIIFAADAFVEHYVGGAELTTEAVIEKSLTPTYKILCNSLTPMEMSEGKDFFWIFANFSSLSDECLLYAAQNLNYSVLEYDYKFCKYRSIEKHIEIEGKCECQNSKRGKLVSIFLNYSKTNWWMSEGQKEIYKELFPFLSSGDNKVLTSVLSDESLNLIESYDVSNKNDKWIILNSQSWIKGVDSAVEYAKENNLEYELVWGLDHKQFLQKLAESKGLIFLPLGGDTCPRLVIEAKLLGCELVLNDNVQHKDEPWFADKDTALSYLRKRTNVFWEGIDNILHPVEDIEEENHFTIVVPSYNNENWVNVNMRSIIEQNYKNYDVFYVDDSSTDKTKEKVEEIVKENNFDKIRIISNKKNKKALHNICHCIAESKEDTIIILLDGDDWLAHRNVLAKLNDIYNDDVWITAGSYIDNAQGLVKKPEIDASIWKKNIRKHFNAAGHNFSHLRTFRKKLYDKIKTEDLLDEDGEHYKYTFDQALMFPMVEMSGPDHFYEVNDILLTYNRRNPLSVDKVSRGEQLRIEKVIKNKQPYDRVEKI